MDSNYPASLAAMQLGPDNARRLEELTGGTDQRLFFTPGKEALAVAHLEALGHTWTGKSWVGPVSTLPIGNTLEENWKEKCGRCANLGVRANGHVWSCKACCHTDGTPKAAFFARKDGECGSTAQFFQERQP